MSSFVLDSSAIIAVLNREEGSERALQFFANAIVSSVNVAEVLSKSLERGFDLKSAVMTFNLLQLNVIDLDFEQAIKAAELRPLTKHLGLSLGDRCCLGLAALRNKAAVTADKNWKKLTFCEVELIR